MGKQKTVRFVSFLGIFLATVVGGSGACSGGGSGDDDDGASASGGRSGEGGTSGFGGSPFNGSAGFPGTGGSGGGQTQALVVDPAKVTLTAKGASVTQQFTAKLPDGTPVTGAAWSVDDVSVGLVGANGVFTSKAFSGGVTRVTATHGGRKGSAVVEVVVDLAQNPGNVSPDDQGKLQTGGDPKAIGFLYPYDYQVAGADVPTVFPRGVGAPLVQLTGAKASAMRLLVETAGYRYEGFFGPARTPDGKAELTVNQVPLPDEVWQGLAASARPGEKVTVTATALVGGTAIGPVQESWTFAPGSLKGIVYYNSYDSRLPGVPEDSDGRPGGPAVLAIKPGQTAEPLLTGCTVCHSVSSQGNRLATGIEWAAGDIDPGDEPNNPRDSASYELTADGKATLRHEEDDGRRYSFGALSPDGAWFLSHGVVGEDSRFIRGLQGDATVSESKLYETDTGAVVPTTGLGVQFAMTPAFSHDGSMLAFNRIGPFPLPDPPVGNNDPALDPADRSTLSVVTFNGAVSPPAFGPVVNVLDATVAPVKAGEKVRAWPSFLPDTRAVVYHEGTQFDTGNSKGAGDSKAFAHIRMVELATKRVVALRALNGETPNGASALPTYPGDATDHSSMNYEPTVLPVPVGGYYWVFFTSRRAYGNTISPGGVVAGGGDAFGSLAQTPQGPRENPSPRKKIWVAAIDLDYAEKLAADPTYDPSHPAFFVTGQELPAGNMRAFAALEPCRQQGSDCASSTECCDGRSCRQNGTDASGQPLLQCIEPPADECAREDESCETAADCCQDATNSILCINGRCARKPPVIK
jgi:hypothetical protein